MKRFLRRLKRRIKRRHVQPEEGLVVYQVISVQDYTIMRFFNKSTREWNAMSNAEKETYRDSWAYAHRL